MDQQQLLRQLRPWILKVAWGLSRDPEVIQDLAQEGWIAAWRSIPKATDNPYSMAKKAALWRMSSIIHSNEKTFGSEHRSQGSAGAPPTPTDDIPQFGVLENYIELAYHYNEINQAVEELAPKQKEYVRLRFWGGFDTPELKTHYGYEPSTIWQMAKRNLNAKLEHLKDEKL